MNPDDAASGPSPVWSTQGAKRPWTRSSSNVSAVQSRQLVKVFPANSTRPRRPKRLQRLPAQLRAVPRPELRAEQAERDVGVRQELGDRALPARPERLDVLLVRGGQEDAPPVREEGRGRELGVQVLQAARVEIVLQLGVGGRAHEQRMPGGVDLVEEPGLGDLLGANRPAEPRVPLEHTDLPALLRQQRRRDERVDPAADRDRVVAPHVSPSMPRRSCDTSHGGTSNEAGNVVQLADSDPHGATLTRSALNRRTDRSYGRSAYREGVDG